MEIIASGDVHIDFDTQRKDPSLTGLRFKVQILKASGDLYASLEQLKPAKNQWDPEERKDLAFVRLVGGYSEIRVDAANKLETRVQEATKAKQILDTIEALEKRESKLRVRCGPLDAVEWQEQELKRVREKIAEEEKRFSSIEAAADLGGAKKK